MIISTAAASNQSPVTAFAKWDGRGITVNQGMHVSARVMFEQADALFTVEKRELSFPLIDEREPEDSPHRIIHAPTGAYGLVRTDKQSLLGMVTDRYEIVQNDSLLRMAEFIREEVSMDTVVVLSDGARVAFTAQVNGASAEVVEGDQVKQRFVGYLGHDGKTGCGAMFTNIRVICSNTLATARSKADSKVSIRHKNGANESFERLIQSIDIARQSFVEDIEVMKTLAATPCNEDQFREFLSRCYSRQLAVPVTDDQGTRSRKLEDLRVFPHLRNAFDNGLGAEFSRGTMWGAVNALTEVETSTAGLTAVSRIKRFNRATFGAGQDMSLKAMTVAAEMLSV
jgi:phage/plasmid-like protein (TIGR03299 family)